MLYFVSKELRNSRLNQESNEQESWKEANKGKDRLMVIQLADASDDVKLITVVDEWRVL